MKRCTRCINPNTVPGLEFDEEGVCDFCRAYQQTPVSGEKALEEVAKAAKSKGAAYDCLVPISGGRDSAYVLYAVSRLLGMKPLAVNYDSEFRTPEAVENMKNACATLGVDAVEYRSKRDIAHSIVKRDIRYAEPLRKYNVCNACAYGYRGVAYREAHKRRIPLIVWGSSQVEDMADSLVHANRLLDQQYGEKLSFVRRLARKYLSPCRYRVEYAKFLQRIEFPSPGHGVFNRRFPRLRESTIQEISYFDYVPWNRQKIKQTIVNELGWKKPEHAVSTWRIDCTLGALVNFYFIKLFGCTKDGFGYSRMINAGQMTREEALQQEEEVLRRMQDTRSIQALLEEIGLTPGEIAEILVYQPGN
ncbi:MAG: hypothetical protein ABIJ00_00855 [Candidatus Eisenbacteria bacterium]